MTAPNAHPRTLRRRLNMTALISVRTSKLSRPLYLVLHCARKPRGKLLYEIFHERGDVGFPFAERWHKNRKKYSAGNTDLRGIHGREPFASVLGSIGRLETLKPCGCCSYERHHAKNLDSVGPNKLKKQFRQSF